MPIILESTIVKTSTSKAHLTFINTKQVNNLADLNEFNTLLAEKKQLKTLLQIENNIWDQMTISEMRRYHLKGQGVLSISRSR